MNDTGASHSATEQTICADCGKTLPNLIPTNMGQVLSMFGAAIVQVCQDCLDQRIFRSARFVRQPYRVPISRPQP